MEYSFDLRGHLMPYEKISMSLQSFQSVFVDSFEEESTRHKIFTDYLRYLDDFQREITTDFVQWINGSFVTRKSNPGDLDLVTIIDHKVFQEKEQLIEDCYRLLGAKQSYGIDAYTVRRYPQDHPKHTIFRNELVYWNHWFSHSKKNRAKKTFEKGFIELIFTEHV